MPYSASVGTLSNKPYSPTTAIPTDGRTYFYDATAFNWRPFQSTAEVLAFLDTATKRSGHTAIVVNSGGTFNTGVAGFGAFTGGTYSEYWFKDGTTDGNLVARDIETLQSVSTRGFTTNTPIELTSGDKTSHLSVQGNLLIDSGSAVDSIIPLDVKGNSANSRLFRVGDEVVGEKFAILPGFAACVVPFVALQNLSIGTQVENYSNVTPHILFVYNKNMAGDTANNGGIIKFRDEYLNVQTLTISDTVVTATGDMEVTTVGKSFVLKSPNGNRWRIVIDNAGAITGTAL